MNIAVTGATGFVGREFLKQAKAAGHSLLPLVRKESGLTGEVVIGELSAGAFSAGDLTDVDIVVHLAARTHVLNDSADGDTEYERVNVSGTAALLDAVIAAGVKRFVYMSSVKAIGEYSLPGQPLTFDTPARPEDPYGRTKLAAENLVRAHSQAAGVDWVILRPPLVFGPGVKANFARMVAAVAKGLPLPLKSIANSRSLVDVVNLAQATLLACEVRGAASHAFMVADATISTPSLLQAIGRAAGRPARLIAVPGWINGGLAKLAGKSEEYRRLSGNLELDTNATCSILGWTPRRNFADGIAATVAAQLGLAANERKAL